MWWCIHQCNEQASEALHGQESHKDLPEREVHHQIWDDDHQANVPYFGKDQYDPFLDRMLVNIPVPKALHGEELKVSHEDHHKRRQAIENRGIEMLEPMEP